jgi:hypothetical protein
MRVFIYGAGNFGAKLLVYFQSIGCRVNGFIQTDEPKQEEYLGLELFSFHEFVERMESHQWKKEEISIAIAIGNEEANPPCEKEVLAGHNTCNICGIENVEFDMLWASGWRCPVCGSIHRYRFVYWVLQNKTDVFCGGEIRQFFISHQNHRYMTY